jgi:hypothetical protein
VRALSHELLWSAQSDIDLSAGSNQLKPATRIYRCSEATSSLKRGRLRASAAWERSLAAARFCSHAYQEENWIPIPQGGPGWAQGYGRWAATPPDPVHH